MNLSILFKK